MYTHKFTAPDVSGSLRTIRRVPLKRTPADMPFRAPLVEVWHSGSQTFLPATDAVGAWEDGSNDEDEYIGPESNTQDAPLSSLAVSGATNLSLNPGVGTALMNPLVNPTLSLSLGLSTTHEAFPGVKPRLLTRYVYLACSYSGVGSNGLGFMAAWTAWAVGGAPYVTLWVPATPRISIFRWTMWAVIAGQPVPHRAALKPAPSALRIDSVVPGGAAVTGAVSFTTSFTFPRLWREY